MPAKPEFEPRDPDWDRKVRENFARQTFMDTVGGRISALSPGFCEIEIPFRPDLCQQDGYLHGGVTTGIAANAGGYAALSLMPPGASVLGVEYKINLMDPAEGSRFFARGQVIKPGRNLYVVEVDVLAEQGEKQRIISKMLTTMFCVMGKSEKA